MGMQSSANPQAKLEELPSDVITELFASMSDVKSVVSLGATNTLFKDYLGNSFWKKRCINEFSSSLYHKYLNYKYANWKELYKKFLAQEFQHRDHKQGRLLSLIKHISLTSFKQSNFSLDDLWEVNGVDVLSWLVGKNKQEYLDYIYRFIVKPIFAKPVTQNMIIRFFSSSFPLPQATEDDVFLKYKEKTLLYFAVYLNQSLDELNWLLTQGAIVENDHLDIAVARGDLDKVKFLSAKLVPNQISCLSISISHGHLHLVEYFSDSGFDLKINGLDALHLAAKHGHIEIIKYLLEKGLDVDSRILDNFSQYDPVIVLIFLILFLLKKLDARNIGIWNKHFLANKAISEFFEKTIIPSLDLKLVNEDGAITFNKKDIVTLLNEILQHDSQDFNAALLALLSHLLSASRIVWRLESLHVLIASCENINFIKLFIDMANKISLASKVVNDEKLSCATISNDCWDMVVRYGNLNVVKMLIKQNIPLPSDATCNQLVLTAINHQHFEMTRYLIEDAKLYFVLTEATMKAMVGGDYLIFKYLLNHPHQSSDLDGLLAYNKQNNQCNNVIYIRMLQNYIATLELRPEERLSFFGFSKTEKLTAANCLLNVLLGNVDDAQLDEHKAVLLDGRLGGLVNTMEPVKARLR